MVQKKNLTEGDKKVLVCLASFIEKSLVTPRGRWEWAMLFKGGSFYGLMPILRIIFGTRVCSMTKIR